MNTAFADIPTEGLDIQPFDAFGFPFRENPFAYHPELHASSPMFVMMEGVPSAIVSSYAQIVTVVRNFKAFSSLKPKGLPGMERIDFFNSFPVMNYSDPPDHTRRRKVVNPAFTPKRTQMLNEQAQLKIDALLDSIAGRPEFDVMAELAKPLSIDTLLTRFMGLTSAQQKIFLKFVQTLPLLDKVRPGGPKPPAYLEAWAEGVAFCREQQELARTGQCDNLVGLIAQSADGGTISEDEMMAMMIVLLTGGVSTVAGAAASSLLYLARNAEVGERVRNDPSLAVNVLEEAMRMDPPVTMVMRFAVEDTQVGDKLIRKGMPVYVMLSVGCKDPAVFPDPYRFDIDRPNVKDHLAFGQGMHTCIGNAITRNVIPLVVRAVAQRFPNLRVADRPDAVEYDVSTPRARHLRHLWLSAN